MISSPRIVDAANRQIYLEYKKIIMLCSRTTRQKATDHQWSANHRLRTAAVYFCQQYAFLQPRHLPGTAIPFIPFSENPAHPLPGNLDLATD